MALPGQFKSARMTGSTPGKDIPTHVGTLEGVICDAFGFTIDSNITVSPTQSDNAGVLAKALLRQKAAAPVGIRILDITASKEVRMVNNAGYLAFDYNNGTEGSPAWVNKFSLDIVSGALALISVSLSGGVTIGTVAGVLKGTAGVISGAATTSDMPEGTNLYYTDVRAMAAISTTATGLTYTGATGVLSLAAGYIIPSTTHFQSVGTGDSPNFTGLTVGTLSGVLKASAGVVAGSATTADLPENTNLYYTDVRATAAAVAAISNTATGLTYTAGVLSLAAGYIIPSTTHFQSVGTNDSPSFTAVTAGSLSVAAGKLAVDTNGNLTKINNVTASFPASQGAVGSVLANDGSGNLTWALPSFLPGSVAQVVNYQRGDYVTGTTSIPFDDTIPQNTEGDQYLSLAITPKSATNKLRIDVVLLGGTDILSFAIGALFQDTTASALASSVGYCGGTEWLVPITFTYYMTAGTTSATTFKVRAGRISGFANSFAINGQGGVSRKLGGVLYSSITITEIVV